MTAFTDVQRVLAAHTPADLQPLIDDGYIWRDDAEHYVTRINLCLHPLLTISQAQQIARKCPALIAVMKENATLRLGLQTDLAVLRPGGMTMQDLENRLEAEERVSAALPAGKAIAHAISGFSVSPSLGIGLTSVSAEGLILIIRVLQIRLLARLGRTFQYADEALTLLSALREQCTPAVRRLLNAASKEVLTYVLFSANLREVAKAEALFLEVAHRFPPEDPTFIRELTTEMPMFPEVPPYVRGIWPHSTLSAEARDGLAAASLARVLDGGLHEEAPLAVWALSYTGVGGLIAAARNGGPLSQEALSSLLRVASLGGMRGNR